MQKQLVAGLEASGALGNEGSVPPLHHHDHSQPLDIQTITFDGKGNLWALTNLGIQICDQNGRVRAILRLPQGIDAANEITISGGYVWIFTPTADWRRRLNVTSPILGLRPESQGQG